MGICLDGKQNRLVDTLLNTLLRIAKNLLYEQITKEEKGKLHHRSGKGTEVIFNSSEYFASVLNKEQ